MDTSVFDRTLPVPVRLRDRLRDRTAQWFGRGGAAEEEGPCRAAPVAAPVAAGTGGRPMDGLIDALGPEPTARAMPVEALAFQGVTHRFGRLTAVDDVSITVGAGEIVCLCGPSGCGKSTLLRLAAGLERLQAGVVRVGGQVVADAAGSIPPERRGVGLVFQDYALFPHLNVLDNVRFGLSGTPAESQRRRAHEALAQVGMADYAEAFPHQLSGGQQQRVALARALAPKPAVLLLDEPFSGLDARLRDRIRDETLHVLKKSGTATLLVTHDPEEAMFLADRIALMRSGQIVQLGCPVDLYTRPANAFAAAFFGEVNALRGEVRGGVVETPLGRLPALGHACGCCMADGAPVDVLIRPEALHLAPLASGAPASGSVPTLARVMAARLLGRSSLVHLSLPDGRGGSVHLHARVPGQFLPVEDSHVSVALDCRQAFVFPADDTN